MKKEKRLTKKKLKKLAKREVKKQFKEWSMKVKEKDGFKCIICGRTEFLNSHHIINRLNKELQFDIMNGVTLCPNCHHFSNKLSAHKNSFVFILWLLENRIEQFKYLKNKIEIIEKII